MIFPFTFALLAAVTPLIAVEINLPTISPPGDAAHGGALLGVRYDALAASGISPDSVTAHFFRGRCNSLYVMFDLEQVPAATLEDGFASRYGDLITKVIRKEGATHYLLTVGENTIWANIAVNGRPRPTGIDHPQAGMKSVLLFQDPRTPGYEEMFEVLISAEADDAAIQPRAE